MRFTAASLFGALLLGALGWFVSDLIRPEMPPTTIFGYFNFVNAGLGLVVGWRLVGRRAGRGVTYAVSTGVTAAVLMAFWGVFLQAGNEMLRLSMRRMYKGPMDGLEDMMRLFADYGAMLLRPTIGIPLVVGAILVAILVEFINSVWR